MKKLKKMNVKAVKVEIKLKFLGLKNYAVLWDNKLQILLLLYIRVILNFRLIVFL